MRNGILGSAAAIGLVAIASPAAATTTVGGYSFEDNAFADQVISSSGNYVTSGGSLTEVLTDTDAGTYAFTKDAGAFLELGFADNVVVNGSGNDIVLFETGFPDTWLVTIMGVSQLFTAADTGEDTGGFDLTAVAFDLSSFGLAPGASISSLRLDFVISTEETVASTSLVGALNSADVGAAVPEPATWATMLLGMFGIGGVMRRRKVKTSVRYA